MKHKVTSESQKIDPKTQKLLNDVIGNANDRDLFIRTALHAENVIDQWLEKKFKIPEKVLDNQLFFYGLKLDILKNAGDVYDPYLYNLKEISEIRNRYAHKLDPKEENIRRMIMTMKVPDNFAIPLKKERNPLDYFKFISIATILEMESALKYKRRLYVKSKK